MVIVDLTDTQRTMYVIPVTIQKMDLPNNAYYTPYSMHTNT